MAKKVDYSAYKKSLWEAWRVFFVAFSAVIYTQFQAGVDLKNYKAWLGSLFVSGVIAGVKATSKWYREVYGKGEYTKLIYKLPF